MFGLSKEERLKKSVERVEKERKIKERRKFESEHYTVDVRCKNCGFGSNRRIVEHKEMGPGYTWEEHVNFETAWIAKGVSIGKGMKCVECPKCGCKSLVAYMNK